jgi:hypothetical protein
MNRITLALTVACLAFGGWAVWEHIQRTNLEDKLAEVESEGNARAIRGVAGRANAADEAKSQKGKTGSQDPAGSEKEGIGRTGGAAGDTKDPAGEMAAGFAKMMTNPKMRDMMKAQARMGIEMVYRDLYDLLDLKEPQRSKLEKLINEKATVGLEAGFEMLDGNKTAEDRKAAAAEVKSKVAELDQQIKDMLGKEDYENVNRYEDSTMERLQLKAFDGMLSSKNIPLDEPTEARLMDVMFKERERFPFASSYLDQRNADLTRFTPDNTARFNDEFAQMNDSIAKKAAGLLSEEQLGIFRQSQEQQTNMINMRLGMVAKMFGGDGAK